MEQPNQTYIDSLSGNDIKFKKKLIDVIKKEFPTEKQTYFDSCKTENYKLAASLVHKIKHKITILGLEKGYKVAVAYENDLLKGVLRVKPEFDAILVSITKYLEEI